MTDDTATSAESPTVEIETEYRTRTGVNNSTEVVTETITLDVYEVEDLLQQALRGTLQDVDSRTIEREIQYRSR